MTTRSTRGRARRDERRPAPDTPLRLARRVSTATPIRPASEPPPPLVPREWRLRLDPLLLIAAVGLVAASCIAIKGSTADDVPGDPLYYFERQLAYGVVGVLLMYGLSRVDYSRLRE